MPIFAQTIVKPVIFRLQTVQVASFTTKRWLIIPVNPAQLFVLTVSSATTVVASSALEGTSSSMLLSANCLAKLGATDATM